MNRQRYLEFCKTPIYVPFVIYGPVAVALIVCAFLFAPITPGHAALLVVGGLFSWTLIEYFLHRFPFHNTTKKEPWRFLTSGQHMLHHELPNDKDHVASPIINSVIIFCILLGIIWMITGNLAVTALWGAGIAFGYLFYEHVHYATHHFKPRTPIGKYLKKHHSLHHFQDSYNYYGVTSPLWDIVFGSKPEVDLNKEKHIIPVISMKTV